MIRSWNRSDFLRQAHDVIRDIAEAKGHLVGDHRELAAREPADCIALRDKIRRIERLVFELQHLSDDLVPAAERLLLETLDPHLHLLDHRPVVVDHHVDDVMQQPDRPPSAIALVTPLQTSSRGRRPRIAHAR